MCVFCYGFFVLFDFQERKRKSVQLGVWGSIWEKLRKGKYNQNILYIFFRKTLHKLINTVEYESHLIELTKYLQYRNILYKSTEKTKDMIHITNFNSLLIGMEWNNF